jgi:hypothetical protein
MTEPTTHEIEDGIAAAFGRKYWMFPERTGHPRPNNPPAGFACGPWLI